jgi:hypothetical protein
MNEDLNAFFLYYDSLAAVSYAIKSIRVILFFFRNINQTNQCFQILTYNDLFCLCH